MYRRFAVFLVFLTLGNRTFSQAPSIDWQRSFPYATIFFDIQKTPDNGLVLAGCENDHAFYENARVLTSRINPAFIYKTDSLGTVKWLYYAGASGMNNLYGLVSSGDGNYIGAGSMYSDFTNNNGDVLLEKVSNTGTRIWSKLFGGNGEDKAFSICQTLDGSVVFAGYTSSIDGNVTGNHGNQDVWIGKCDMSGTLLWQKCLGGTGNDSAHNIIQLSDGGLLIAGATTSTDGNVTTNAGNADAWLIKLDANGNLIWQKTFGGSGSERFKKVQVTPDGGYIAIGHTFSTDGIVSNNHGLSDVWVVKCDNNGNLQWQKCYGGSADDIGSDIKPVEGGGYILNSYTKSSDGDVRTNYGGADQWVIKIMDNGVIEWAKSIGTAQNESTTAILPLNRSQFVTLANQGISYGKGLLTKLTSLNDITGIVYVDVNANGVRDTDEPFFNNATVKSVRTDGYKKSSGITNGIFLNSVEPGTYETSISFLNPNYTAEPISYTSTFSGLFGRDEINFQLTPVSTINDVRISIYPTSAARPGFPAYYHIHYKNEGTTALSNVIIELKKDSRCSVMATNPIYQTSTGNTIIWNIGSLPVLSEGIIDIGLQLQNPPTLNNGDTLRFSVKAELPITDNSPANNFDTLVQVTTGSYDPNDKTESHGGIISPAQISGSDPLTYIIRFQNTGTDTAFNITVKDTLDNRLDWSSLQMISSSHTYQLSIENDNELTWLFNNIKLPYTGIDESNSHGYIAYRINPKPTVPLGDTIKNTAGIYFDYNLPILTNTENTVVFQLTPLPVTLASFNAVPENDMVNIIWNTKIEEFVKHFEVQRSLNGSDFSTIGIVKPGQKTYLFKDAQPIKGNNYYRLKSVDEDGSFNYSTIAMVNWNNGADVISSLYPNPVTGNATLKLQGLVDGKVRINVFDQQGRLITIKQFGEQNTREFKTNLDLGKLPAGNYVLQIIVHDKAHLQKLLIQ
jgi:uncharacterized repeat protein (TIGR01451 family)